MTISYLYKRGNDSVKKDIGWKKMSENFNLNKSITVYKLLNKENILRVSCNNYGISTKNPCLIDFNSNKKSLIRFITTSYLSFYHKEFIYHNYLHFDIFESSLTKFEPHRFMYCKFKNDSDIIDLSTLLIGMPYCYPGNTTLINFFVNDVLHIIEILVKAMEKNQQLTENYTLEIFEGCKNTPFGNNIRHAYKNRIRYYNNDKINLL